MRVCRVFHSESGSAATGSKLSGQESLGRQSSPDFELLEAFGVSCAAGKSSKCGNCRHYLEDVYFVVFLEPLNLALMTAQHLFLLLKSIRDVHMIFGYEIDTKDTISKEYLGNYAVSFVLCFEQWRCGEIA